MAVKINFDVNGIPEKPTLILANRSGNKIGQINAQSITVGDSLNDADEITFKVYKYLNGQKDVLWNQIKDFKLVYCKESNLWYEMTVTIEETNETIKTVSCTQLAHAELSQINLYEFQVNTEDDIARDDYKPTVLYNSEDEEASLLHRMFKDKAKHYTIVHVDSTIANIQRTFEWDDISIMDACNEIAEEIKCRFEFNHDFDGNGEISRTVAVYDLETNCLACNYRGDFTGTCPKCGSSNINEGFGNDTTIFITADELGEDINYETDNGSVKNCFKLVAGDDLMTATVRNCNPNGSDYIWHISDEMKEDMSSALVAKLEDYDENYDYYQNEYSISLDSTVPYNTLIAKYVSGNSDLESITSPIIGYPALMLALYKVIDTALYLQSEMMPSVELASTSASAQAALLTAGSISPVAVTNLTTISNATADNAVLAMAKCIIDPNYQVKVNSSSLSGTTWTGNFKVTNYSDEEDTATSSTISVTINDDYETYVNQKINKVLAKKKSEDTDVVTLFQMTLTNFDNELKKYCLDSLNYFYDMCQSCLDILIEQGIADGETWSGKNPNLYEDLYYPYRRKLEKIQAEQAVRESEIGTVSSLQDELLSHRNTIQSALNFETYLGTTLWLEFCAYRREDKYENTNFISDGLNNSQLFDRAEEFVELATKELKKSAELQHSITATLHNLLIIPKFKPLINNFAVGNWLRIRIDDQVYKLRLLYYSITYDELDNIEIEFSDVLKTADGMSDQQSVIQQASSMASSYDAVQYQASQGAKSKKQLDNWVNNGLALTNMKIIGNADNQNISWDSHGFLCREYLPITDAYSDRQLKIINKGVYLTDDGWETARAGIGNFNYYDPEDGIYKEGYGVIADTIIGNLILSEKVGIYNTENSITLDKNGFVLTTNSIDDDNTDVVFVIQKRQEDENDQEYITQLMYVTSDGELVINGSIKINTASEDLTTLNELTDPSRVIDPIVDQVSEDLDNRDAKIQEDMADLANGMQKTIDDTADIVREYADGQLNSYKAEIGQYMSFDENGLTLGAASSDFKTVIDNTRMAFWDGQTVAAYISNRQLYIPSAVIGTMDDNGNIMNGTMMIGNFMVASRKNGGVSVSWQGSSN